MEFRIADTFTRSLTKLTNQEQKAVKVTALDLQLDPTSPGMKFHRIDRSKDANFWSLRVNRDVRMVVHKTASSVLLCYVDHHDDAYSWAERRKIERHPKTGAAQLVEVRETVEDIPSYEQTSATELMDEKPLVFAEIPEAELLSYGVPAEWIGDVRKANEDSLFNLTDRLPQEAAEALLEIATGNKPKPVTFSKVESDPFAHPDAQRRFRTLTSVEELERALDYPWEQWAVFLHPAQRKFVEQDYDGPVRISGSAGTGKTIVALHRAVTLARRNPDANIAITTFSPALSNALKQKLKYLVGNEPDVRKRIIVHPVSGIGLETYKRFFGEPKLTSREDVRSLIDRVSKSKNLTNQVLRFLFDEWERVVDAWQVKTWEAYRDIPRLGRKTRINEAQRKGLWAVFTDVRSALAEQNLITWPELFYRVTEKLQPNDETLFDFVVVDEAQDVDVAELRFLSALGSKRADSLFFVGDLGQRIFQQPFSWSSLGVDVKGRSHTLRINYRTSEEIRDQVDRLLPQAISDVDENKETRDETISVLNGPPPTVQVCDSRDQETKMVSDWIKARAAEGILPNEIGVFVRSEDQVSRAKEAVQAAGLKAVELTESVSDKSGHVSLGTMHMAKGLEFRAVVVMACDDEVTPLQARIESVTDPSDLEEVYNTERHLLYVACTRARDYLLITAVKPGSEFLDDLETLD